MPNVGARAAPSSIARGSPSRRRHSSAMSSTSVVRRRPFQPLRPLQEEPDRRIVAVGSGRQRQRRQDGARARRRRRAVRGWSPGSAGAAPLRPVPPRAARARPAPARRCPGRAAPTTRAGTPPARPPASSARGIMTPVTSANVSTTRSGATTVRSAQNARRPCPASWCAASRARRVLPTPPGPTSVTCRWSADSRGAAPALVPGPPSPPGRRGSPGRRGRAATAARCRLGRGAGRSSCRMRASRSRSLVDGSRPSSSARSLRWSR